MCGEQGQAAQLICNRSLFISTPTQSVGNPFQLEANSRFMHAAEEYLPNKKPAQFAPAVIG
jgi:hypothetical protein